MTELNLRAAAPKEPLTVEKRPASLARKIGCVVLLGVGVSFLLGSILNMATLLAGGLFEPGAAVFLLVLLLLGVAVIWMGTSLWERWPTALGVIFAVFGVVFLAGAYGLFLRATSKPSRMVSGIISLVPGIISFLLGLLFLFRRYLFRRYL